MPDQKEPWTRLDLPEPYSDGPWRQDQRDALEAFRRFHRVLLTSPGSPAAEDFDPSALWLAPDYERARSYCDHFDLDAVNLDRQLETAPRFYRPIRMVDAASLEDLIGGWTVPHGRLVAGLAGIGGYSWHEQAILDLSRGFFLTGSMMVLPEDAAHDRIMFPLVDLEQAGVYVEDLKAGKMSHGVRKLLWKQVVRARDSFARAQNLVDDLTRRQAATFRRWWFFALEMLHSIERNGYDVWSRPPQLTRYQRVHARYQARFGRTTFR